MKSKFVHSPFVVRLWHQSSLNLVHRFLSHFGSCFLWAILPRRFLNLKQEAQGLGVLLDKMEDNGHIKLDNIEI